MKLLAVLICSFYACAAGITLLLGMGIVVASVLCPRKVEL